MLTTRTGFWLLQAITLLQLPLATKIFCNAAFEDKIPKQPTVQHNISEHINKEQSFVL